MSLLSRIVLLSKWSLYLELVTDGVQLLWATIQCIIRRSMDISFYM